MLGSLNWTSCFGESQVNVRAPHVLFLPPSRGSLPSSFPRRHLEECRSWGLIMTLGQVPRPMDLCGLSTGWPVCHVAGGLDTQPGHLLESLVTCAIQVWGPGQSPPVSFPEISWRPSFSGLLVLSALLCTSWESEDSWLLSSLCAGTSRRVQSLFLKRISLTTREFGKPEAFRIW